VDLDGDGHADILSGSWPGELFLFRGGPGRTFAAPEMMRYADGGIIAIGGGVNEQPDGSILITGNAEFKNEDGKSFVEYHGRRFDNSDEKPISVTGSATAAHAADWDGDGDLDILVGDIRGNVRLVPNAGSRTEPAFAPETELEAAGSILRVEGDAGPFAADWDGDGDLDLLVGAGDGSVSLFVNAGTARAPRLVAAETILPATQERFWEDPAPRGARRGIRTKICAADWNGDGLLDLLVGDYSTSAPDLPEPSPEEKVRHDRIRAELESVETRFSEIAQKIFERDRPKGKEEHDRLEAEYSKVMEEMQNLRRQVPPESEDHGWVWFFERKPVAVAAAAAAAGSGD